MAKKFPKKAGFHCIVATIRTRRERVCLPYAGFLLKKTVLIVMPTLKLQFKKVGKLFYHQDSVQWIKKFYQDQCWMYSIVQEGNTFFSSLGTFKKMIRKKHFIVVLSKIK